MTGTRKPRRERSATTVRRTPKGLLLAMMVVVGGLCLATTRDERIAASVTAGPGTVRAADFNPYGVNNDRGMVGRSVEGLVLPAQGVHVAMREANIGWVRYSLSWQNVQGGGVNSWDWTVTDHDINAAIAQGMSVYVTIMAAPTWPHGGKNTFGFMHCGDVHGVWHPGNPGCGPGADYARFDPDFGSGPSFYWKRFVTEAVKRYGDRVKYWGFWNEGRNPIFWPEYDEPPCNRFGQLLKKVLRPGREAALAANPSVQIVGPEDDTGELLAFLLNAERNGHAACGIAPGRLFDVISFHAYQNSVGVFETIDNVKNALAGHDRREVWMTEVPTDQYIDGALEQFKKRGWISKIFAYTMRSYDPPPPGFPTCGGYGLVDYQLTRCYSHTAMRNFAVANPPSMRFAGLTAEAGQEDYLLLTNPHGQATTVNMAFSNAIGAQATQSIVMPANSRATPFVSAFPGQYQAVSISTTNPMLPIWAEHANYWNNREAGRAAQGASERSDTWYFAEGTSGGGWIEHISAYNPSTTDTVVVTWTYLHDSTPPVSTSRVLPPRAVLRLPTADVGGVQIGHGTIVSGVWSGGAFNNQPAPITAERTISWGNSIEGHGGKGVAFPSPQWHFAEGANNPAWATYIALMNPNTRAVTARVRYLLPSGFTGWTSYPIGAQRRISFQAGASDTFGIEIRTDGEIPIAAERAMYTGAGWTVGTAGEGAPVTSQRWMFPEGSTLGNYFSPYFLLANPTSTTALVSVNFRREDGVVVPHTMSIGPGQRATISPYDFPSLIGHSFSTEVVVTGASPSGVPPGIVAERAMYWSHSTGWIAGHVALGIP